MNLLLTTTFPDASTVLGSSSRERALNLSIYSFSTSLLFHLYHFPQLQLHNRIS